MKILIDGDSCPVLDIAERLAFRRAVECKVVHDTDHELHPEHSEQIMVDKGPDSADFRIMNLVQPGDIVVTQDIKLAWVLTSMGAYVMDHDGVLYTDYTDPHARFRLPKRTWQQDAAFYYALSDLIWTLSADADGETG